MAPRNTADLTVATPGYEESPRVTRSGRVFPPVPESPAVQRRRLAREAAEREAAEETARLAAEAAAAGPASEENAGADADSAFFDTLGASAANNEAGTDNDNTGRAAAHIRSERAILRAGSEQSNNQNSVSQGWNFGNVEPSAGPAQPPAPARASGGPVGDGPSGSGPPGSGPSRSTPAEDTCEMCSGVVEVLDGVSLHPCRHGIDRKLHHDCVSTWFIRRRQTNSDLICPICYAAVSELHYVHNGIEDSLDVEEFWPREDSPETTSRPAAGAAAATTPAPGGSGGAASGGSNLSRATPAPGGSGGGGSSLSRATPAPGGSGGAASGGSSLSRATPAPGGSGGAASGGSNLSRTTPAPGASLPWTQPFVCDICTRRKNPAEGCVLPCEHKNFDFDCIDHWFRNENFYVERDNGTIPDLTCPMCRAPVIEVRHLYQDDGSYTTVEVEQRWPFRHLLSGRTGPRPSPAAAGRRLPGFATTARAQAPATPSVGSDITMDDFFRVTTPAPRGTRTSQPHTPPPAPPGTNPFPAPRGTRTSQPRTPPPAPPGTNPFPAPRGRERPSASRGRERTAPSGWVWDQDRSDPSRDILKEIVAVYRASNGHRFLLKSESRDPRFPNLEIFELEAQSNFPGEMDRWLTRHSIAEPNPITDLEGRTWTELEITGVADVFQTIRRTVHGEVLMPQRPADGMVRLRSRDDQMADNWFKIGQVCSRFGSLLVRDDLHDHRVKTGQHMPLEPPASRRRQPRPYQTRPVSE